MLAPWYSNEAGALSVQQGTMLWVTSMDESGEWAYARVPTGMQVANGQNHAWVPRAVLQRAVYPTRSMFDARGQAQGLTLNLGDLVHVYHRETTGWTYGARLDRCSAVASGATLTMIPEEIGWFPEACITEPLPVG